MNIRPVPAEDEFTRPQIGDRGFARALRVAYRAGLITRGEQLKTLRLHRRVIEALEPPISEDALMEMFGTTFDSAPSGMEVPMCAYPRHRGEGRDWRADDGRLICGICHPPIVSRFTPENATPVDASSPPDGRGHARPA